MDKSSVVHSVNSPPRRRTPSGKLAQLRWCCRAAARVWEGVQAPAEKVTQLVPVPKSTSPPHATSPAWVCARLAAGSWGSVQVVPSTRISSTEVRAPPALPPVTMIPAITDNDDTLSKVQIKKLSGTMNLKLKVTI